MFFFLVCHFCWSQNVAPILTASGNQAYCPKSQINIVTDFNIVDPDDSSIEALYVQISTGYVSGEDSLTLLGTHPNVMTSWSTVEGKLTLRGIAYGPVNYVDVIAAIKDIVFQSTSNNPTDKTFSITISDANFLPSTGHYYEYVPALGITWTDAKVAAESRFYYGWQGYLATITSADEAQKLFEKWFKSGESKNKPECVFVDLNIIGSSFDGIELIRKINFEFGNNVVIGIISSSDESEEQAKAVAAGRAASAV